MRTTQSPFYIIKKNERGIVESFGKFKRFVEPGSHYQIPLIEITKIIDIGEHSIAIPPEDIVTKDNILIKVGGTIVARPGDSIEDVKSSYYNIHDWKTSLLELAKTNLRQEFSKLNSNECKEDDIDSNIQCSLGNIGDSWGIVISKVEIELNVF